MDDWRKFYRDWLKDNNQDEKWIGRILTLENFFGGVSNFLDEETFRNVFIKECELLEKEFE